MAAEETKLTAPTVFAEPRVVQHEEEPALARGEHQPMKAGLTVFVDLSLGKKLPIEALAVADVFAQCDPRLSTTTCRSLQS